MNKVLITGGAGFIAFHLAHKLKYAGYDVIGCDNFNDYYDPKLKFARRDILSKQGILVEKQDLRAKSTLEWFIGYHKPDVVIHLAAYAGVRHSMEFPSQYIENNIMATQNLIDACEKHGVEKVIYASTSCVMAGQELPWNEDEPTYHQLNPYGYSKRTNECQFRSSNITRTIGLRFFTVYGPWGRPDMALFQFADGIANGTPIEVFNDGDMKRDFTYVDDIVRGIHIILEHIESSEDKYDDIFNIGCGTQVNLMDFISEIEKTFGKKAIKIMKPKHPADTKETWSDTSKIRKLGYETGVQIPEGIANFAEWYKNYYKIN